MVRSKRCGECGATIRRHNRHIHVGPNKGAKRLARWRGHFRAGMGRVARENDPKLIRADEPVDTRVEDAEADEAMLVDDCICCPDCAYNQSTWDHLQATIGAPDGSIKVHTPVEPLFDASGGYL